jgi:SNF2 family DNA or RNA helicase
VNARYLLFYSIDYSAELNYQAIKRIERITQKRAMFVYYFLTQASIDKVIYRVIGKKVAAQASLMAGLSNSNADSNADSEPLAKLSTEADDNREIIKLFLQDSAA